MEKARRIAYGCFGIGILGLAIGLPIIWRHTDIGDAQAIYDKNLWAYKASGLPWTADDLAQKPPVADIDNGAILTWDSMQRSTKYRGYERGCKEVYASASSLNVDDAKKQLSSLMPFVADARKIADKPRFDFKHDWDLGPSLRSPEIKHLKSCGQLLAASAVVAASEGKVDQALSDLSSLNQLSEHAGNSSILVSLLVRISIQTMRARAIEDLCDLWHDDARLLHKLLKVANEPTQKMELSYYLRGEAYLGLATMRNIDRTKNIEAYIAANPENPTDVKRLPILVRSGAPTGWKVKIMMSRYFQMWAYFAQLSKTTDDPIALSRAMDQYTESSDRERLSYIWTAIIVPVFAPAGRSIAGSEASQSTARALVKVQLFKAKSGRYPDSLAEAGVKELDPFTKKELIYSHTGYSCKIYSVGEDLKDDGGKRRSEVKNIIKDKAGYDVVASYPAYRPVKKGSAIPPSASK